MGNMYLRTLGGCSLEGADFRREKPLLLLAYLVLEGPKPRRFLAELFWGSASDPMNSLAVALSKLRALGAASADEERAWSTLRCDSLDFLEGLRLGENESALDLYRGPFLEGLSIALDEELEEWVFATRERLASAARSAFLKLAERAAAMGRFAQAGHLAEQALGVQAAPPAEPPELTRLHALLIAAENPMAETVKREADEVGLNVGLSPEAARGRLRQSLLGRERELERLHSLQTGEWLFVRAGIGMGKTALLRRFAEETGMAYLPARSGLPYATLEPLLGRTIEDGTTTMLRALTQREDGFLLDDWEDVDPESQALIGQLRTLRPSLKLVLAGRSDPPFSIDNLLELGPLNPDALSPFDGAYEATGGVPMLVSAFLRGEGVREALEARLLRLAPEVRTVFLALSLLDEPDPLSFREALGLAGATLAKSLETLVELGLVESNGRVRVRAAAQAYQDGQPAETAGVALQLARIASPLKALPLWQRARALWETQDHDAVGAAYRAWAAELLRRGFPKRAADMLLEAPQHAATALLRARALERAQLYREGLDLLTNLPETPEALALKGAILWRLGRPAEAKQASEAALKGDEAARAEAFNTLGLLAFSSGHHAQAVGYFKRAASLWLLLGDRSRRAGVLNNLAAAQSELGQDAEDAFREALEAAGEDSALRSRTLLNLGRVREKRGDLEGASAVYHEAASIAEQTGALGTAARAWNNLGVLQHNHQLPEARDTYQRSLALARQAGEKLLLATSLANLAELLGDREALEEAIHIFDDGGYTQMADRYRSRLAFMSRSGEDVQA